MKLSEYLELDNAELTRELKFLNQKYREGNPVVSDDVFDYLSDVLRERDPNNPFFKEIGAPVVDAKNKIELPYKMFSLDKIKNEEKPLALWKSKFPNDVLVSLKLDGNSGLFYVKNGKMSLMTRGDGSVGQDISYLIPYIRIFKNSKTKEFILKNFPELAIRGELILSKKDWEEISSVQPELSNPRNAVAGTLNAKAPNPMILSRIIFVAYELVAPVTATPPSDTFTYMNKLGLYVVDSKIIKKKDVTVDNLSEYLLESRETSAFEIDGIVVTENIPHPRDETGNPKYSFAFKSLVTQEQVEVMVTEVEWNVSKDGVLKPLVHFPKVNLNGVEIQKATGFNAKFIEDNVIGPGSRVIIIRAGDVIPHILEVTKESDDGEPSFPDIDYVWNSTNVDILVANEDELDEYTKEDLDIKRLSHFFVKMETDGVAEGVVAKLYKAGYTTLKSIIELTPETIAKIDGFKSRSAEKVRLAIDEALSKATPLKLMVASNMFESGFGDRKLKLIINAYPAIVDITKKYIPTITELVSLEGVAEKTAKAFIEYLPNFWKFVEMNGFGFVFKDLSSTVSTSKNKEVKVSKELIEFLSKKFVFTGFRNKEWKELIESYGGKVTDAVSKQTDYLVVKDPNEVSGKTQKAVTLGIPIISESQMSETLKV
jgi:DNA ligase (NAD+)